MLPVLVRVASAIPRGQEWCCLVAMFLWWHVWESSGPAEVGRGWHWTYPQAQNYSSQVSNSLKSHYHACKHVGGLSWRPHVTDCANVEVAASVYIIDVFVEGESLIERHSETLDVFRGRDLRASCSWRKGLRLVCAFQLKKFAFVLLDELYYFRAISHILKHRWKQLKLNILKVMFWAINMPIGFPQHLSQTTIRITMQSCRVKCFFTTTM